MIISLQTSTISKLIYDTNAKYDKQTMDNDIVILKLKTALKFNANVQPACLPSSPNYLDFNTTEERCFTSGWGQLQYSEN